MITILGISDEILSVCTGIVVLVGVTYGAVGVTSDVLGVTGFVI